VEEDEEECRDDDRVEQDDVETVGSDTASAAAESAVGLEECWCCCCCCCCCKRLAAKSSFKPVSCCLTGGCCSTRRLTAVFAVASAVDDDDDDEEEEDTAAVHAKGKGTCCDKCGSRGGGDGSFRFPSKDAGGNRNAAAAGESAGGGRSGQNLERSPSFSSAPMFVNVVVDSLVLLLRLNGVDKHDAKASVTSSSSVVGTISAALSFVGKESSRGGRIVPRMLPMLFFSCTTNIIPSAPPRPPTSTMLVDSWLVVVI
jgi:hypothetical protein